MSDDNATSLIRQLHAAGTRVVLCITGGGSAAIGELLAVPGGSASLLEATVPYSSQALTAFLGSEPANYCSERTARAMAMAAFERARRYTAPGDTAPLAGVACTASLASDRPKHGEHRAHLAVQTLSDTWTGSLILTKGARSRADEERLVSQSVLNAMAEACGVPTRLPLALLTGEQLQESRTVAPPAWQDLITLKRRTHCQSGSAAPLIALLPGAFNPRHDAHREMARMGSELLGGPVAFELSLENVDKPLVDYCDLAQRVSQFGPEETLWLTRAPTFVEKAKLFPGVTFIVGADTIRRIAEPKYYGDSIAARDGAIEQLVAARSRFLVFGRTEAGELCTLEQLNLPPALRGVCRAVPIEQFRMDISSTDIRRRVE
ncbi:MAG: hypothetical protein K8T25_07560 [Planctomycetia bacterium]|nr:hypothetical protein [Planctomycetia bacterium]